ncbi:HNH endonuclease [Abeliophyllum distichum]|uniref:HNH endonuclease n=1 Tax=Abeliophyllum distichum TaxID=126358 RepID=A0ABD1RX08_9LAMI
MLRVNTEASCLLTSYFVLHGCHYKEGGFDFTEVLDMMHRKSRAVTRIDGARDPLGNTVFRKLVGCPGCLCHDYDHIIPYSKGGKSTLENCQVLQATVNRSKGNRTEISKADLIQKSAYCRVSDRDMDLLELSAYGNVRRGQDSGGCSIQ